MRRDVVMSSGMVTVKPWLAATAAGLTLLGGVGLGIGCKAVYDNFISDNSQSVKFAASEWDNVYKLAQGDFGEDFMGDFYDKIKECPVVMFELKDCKDKDLEVKKKEVRVRVLRIHLKELNKGKKDNKVNKDIEGCKKAIKKLKVEIKESKKAAKPAEKKEEKPAVDQKLIDAYAVAKYNFDQVNNKADHTPEDLEAVQNPLNAAKQALINAGMSEEEIGKIQPKAPINP